MNHKTILDLNNDEVCTYFLEEKHYCNIDLPNYFTFQEILNEIDRKIKIFRFLSEKT